MHVTQGNLCLALHVIICCQVSEVIIPQCQMRFSVWLTSSWWLRRLFAQGVTLILLLPTSSHRWGFNLAAAWKRKCVSGRFFWFLNPTCVHLNLDKVAPERRLRGIATISYEIGASIHQRLPIQTLLGILISKHFLHPSELHKTNSQASWFTVWLSPKCQRQQQRVKAMLLVRTWLLLF